MALGWVQQHHLGRVGSPRVRGRGCCDSSLDMGLQRKESSQEHHRTLTQTESP